MEGIPKFLELRGDRGSHLTTDDDFLRKALQKKEVLKVRLENPVKWLMEEIEK